MRHWQRPKALPWLPGKPSHMHHDCFCKQSSTLPRVAFLESGLPFESMDDLYRSAEDFDALTSAIVHRLLDFGNGCSICSARPRHWRGPTCSALQGRKSGWRARLFPTLFWLCGSGTFCAARTARSMQSAHPFCNSASMPARSLCSAMHRRNRYAYACGGS